MAALGRQDMVLALRWLERAHRLIPRDANATLALASVCVAADPARAAWLFLGVVEKHDVRQGWLGLAAARLRLGEAEAAAEAMQAVLSRHAFVPDAAALADQIGGSTGWCALRSDGRLELHPAAPGGIVVTRDGNRLRGKILPPDWILGQTIEVRRAGRHVLGSPIRIGAIRRLSGCVEAWDGGIRGWAWHPNDPGTAPVLTISDSSGGLRQTIVAHDESTSIAATGPLSRPRCFQLTSGELGRAGGPVHVRGPDGKELLGSPLDPGADYFAPARTARGSARLGPAGLSEGDARDPVRGSVFVDAKRPVAPITASRRWRSATIVIPVHNGGAAVLSCLASVLASLPAQARILVVDDGSSEPKLVAALDDLARRRKIGLRRHDSARGFPASANVGINAARRRDVVLLNSDTLVPPNWLERLRAAAYSARAIGTVTPLSNDASILSYPAPAGNNPLPDQAATNRLDALAARANGSATVDIPVGVGFCLYLRRDCLDGVGLFRADLFAQGYGEENDLCLRAGRLGWRNVAVTGLFVGHLGGASFAASAVHLRQRNSRIVEQLHPGYHRLIERFLAADPLAEPRRRIDLLAWQERGRKFPRAAILITHNDGGGVERRLARSVRMHASAGRRPMLLRPVESPGGEPAIALHDGLDDDLPNLVFAVPTQLSALLGLLRRARPDHIEAHHLAGYPPAIYALIARLRLPYDVHVHDYAWFCPRLSLVAAGDRYCGEPDLAACNACIASNGHFLQENITVAALRDRSGRFLANARRVVVPADDTGIRMRRYFPGQPTVTIPHEDDDLCGPVIPRALGDRRTQRCGRAIICVVGAIGVHKGYKVLLSCARDAVARELALQFVVVGHTIDDARLLATGRVFVTGPFDPDEATDLIAAQNAALGFVPSICPETWCLGLGEIWRAGLFAAAFDIGAPAERIKRTGRGIVLPLGLSANAINNTLLAAIRTPRH